MPAELVEVRVGTLVARLRTVTCASPTIAFEASVTVPVTLACSACPKASWTARRSMQQMQTRDRGIMGEVNKMNGVELNGASGFGRTGAGMDANKKGKYETKPILLKIKG